MTQSKGRGRPPKGSAERDGSGLIRQYPRVNLVIRPSTKLKLNAIAAVEGRAAWEVVETAIDRYADQMPDAERTAVQTIVNRKPKQD